MDTKRLRIFISPIIVISITLIVYVILFFAMNYDLLFKFTPAYPKYKVLAQYIFSYLMAALLVRTFTFFITKSKEDGCVNYFTWVESIVVMVVFFVAASVSVYPMSFVLIIAPPTRNLFLHFYLISMVPFVWFKLIKKDDL
jgi:hypothetical protein